MTGLLKKRCGMFLLSVFLIMLFGMTVSAASRTEYKSIDLPQGKTVKTIANKESKDSKGDTVTTITRYRVAAPSSGRLVVTVTAKRDKLLSIRAYDKKDAPEVLMPDDDDEDSYYETSYPYFYDEALYDGKKAVFAVPVDKGSYYLKASAGYDTAGIYMSYTFVSSSQKPNYCRAKATELAAKKKAAVNQTKKYNYNRWYKIKLTKEQKVRVYFDYADRSHRVRLYDSKGRAYATSEVRQYDSNGHQINCYARSKQKLSKGTYYLVILASDSHKDYFATRFWWK